MLAALALAGFCGALNQVVLGPFLPAMARDLGVGVPLLGQAPALANLVAAATGLLIGPLADRYGRRRALALGLLALTVSTVGAALAPTYLVLVAAVLVGSPGRGIAVPLAQAIAGSAFAEPGRRRAVAWTQAGMGASVTLGMPLLTSVDSLLDWRAALLTFAGLSLLATALARAALPPADVPVSTVGSAMGSPTSSAPASIPVGPSATPASPKQAPPLQVRALLSAYLPLLRHRPTSGLIASSLLGNTAISALLTYVGAYLVEVHHLHAVEVGWAFSLSGVGLIVGGILGSRIANRVPARSLALVLMALRGLVMGALLLVPAGLGSVGAAVSTGPLSTEGLGLASAGGLLATLLFTIVGLVDGIYLVSVVLALTAESPAGRGTTMVANGSAVVLGNAIGSAVGGLLLAVGGYSLLALYPPLAALSAAALIWRSGRGTR